MKPQIARLVNQAEQIYSIDSETADATYRVNLKQRTCTCPHFVHRLAGKPANERVCKHQAAVAAQAPFLLAATKARHLSDAQLVTSIRHYQEAGRHEIAGACRVERVRRAQVAAEDARLREVFA